jgi:hypothetical protein
LAQLVARWSYVPADEGSSPSWSILLESNSSRLGGRVV